MGGSVTPALAKARSTVPIWAKAVRRAGQERTSQGRKVWRGWDVGGGARSKNEDAGVVGGEDLGCCEADAG